MEGLVQEKGKVGEDGTIEDNEGQYPGGEQCRHLQVLEISPRASQVILEAFYVSGLWIAQRGEYDEPHGYGCKR